MEQPPLAAAGSASAGEPGGVAVPLSSKWFSGGTGTLNSISGRESEHDLVSSGSVPDGAEVTKVEVSVTVSRGSIPFSLVVVSPMAEQPSGSWRAAAVSPLMSSMGRISRGSLVHLHPKRRLRLYRRFHCLRPHDCHIFLLITSAVSGTSLIKNRKIWVCYAGPNFLCAHVNALPVFLQNTGIKPLPDLPACNF